MLPKFILILATAVLFLNTCQGIELNFRFADSVKRVNRDYQNCVNDMIGALTGIRIKGKWVGRIEQHIPPEMKKAGVITFAELETGSIKTKGLICVPSSYFFDYDSFKVYKEDAATCMRNDETLTQYGEREEGGLKDGDTIVIHKVKAGKERMRSFSFRRFATDY